jgi:glycerate-2-kinase
MVWGGETTVQLHAAAPVAGKGAHALAATEAPPSGGRCQELALAAARQLSRHAGDGRRITILAAGTDGRDGTTDAAGAFADASIWEQIRQTGRDPDVALQRHESHAVLGAAGALLPRRFTGTNVMDVVIGLIE